MNTTFTELDKTCTFLNYVGAVISNSFVQILDSDEDDLNQPQIIHHFLYYDIDKLTSTLNGNKNKFSIFSTNIQSIHAQIDELRIFVKSLNKIKYMYTEKAGFLKMMMNLRFSCMIMSVSHRENHVAQKEV